MNLPDISDKYTVFVPNAHKSSYKSDCPYNEGYYLDGGRGGVKCSRSADILPGHTWYSTCEKEYKRCWNYIEPVSEQLEMF